MSDVVGTRESRNVAPTDPGAKKPDVQVGAKLGDVGKPLPLALGVLIAAGATVVQLLSTYDGFMGEAIGSPGAWALIVMNIAITVALMLGLAPLFKPRNVLLYAITIALSFQTLIATDLAVEPIGGADQVGPGKKINVGFIHTALEDFFTGMIDDPVEDAKRDEIASLRKRYATPDKLTTLRADIDENLRTDGEIDDTERKTVVDQIDGVIADGNLTQKEKVREITLAVYTTAGRDPIKDLLARQ